MKRSRKERHSGGLIREAPPALDGLHDAPLQALCSGDGSFKCCRVPQIKSAQAVEWVIARNCGNRRPWRRIREQRLDVRVAFGSNRLNPLDSALTQVLGNAGRRGAGGPDSKDLVLAMLE
ncbi:hypothetical protein [Roseateles sp. NT4]|uniref:hypothetical protein n=1 Tax=Roseateles sp. NT4 TaxID=3453715 RepID=UPI003F6E8B32